MRKENINCSFSVNSCQDQKKIGTDQFSPVQIILLIKYRIVSGNVYVDRNTKFFTGFKELQKHDCLGLYDD